jgi:hypothetical protein
VTAAAVVLALSGSLRFAQIALAMAAALFGIVIVAAVRRDESQLTGIALLFSVASVGCLLIGRVNSFSNVPLASYLMIPAAPLFAWCGCIAPLARYSGVKRMLAIVTVPLAILAAAVLIAAVTELGAEAAY